MKAIIILTCVVLLGLIAGCAPATTEAVSTTASLSPPTPTPSQTPTPKADNEFQQALADIWIEDDHTKIGNISIVRKCSPFSAGNDGGTCELAISSDGQLVRSFSADYGIFSIDGVKGWLQYGLIDLLGKGTKQLIIHTYSGGAHCCDDYVIYAIFPTFHVIYDSTLYSDDSEIGYDLHPVDIDRDGVFEFYQYVMAFDYLGSAGHAGSSFPPAIFAYDSQTGKYILANKRFPAFVMEQLEAVFDGREGRLADRENEQEYLVRTRFLFMVYAGKRDEAWKYFDANYRSNDPRAFRERFREDYRESFKKLFAKDPTYLSIYGK